MVLLLELLLFLMIADMAACLHDCRHEGCESVSKHALATLASVHEPR